MGTGGETAKDGEKEARIEVKEAGGTAKAEVELKRGDDGEAADEAEATGPVAEGAGNGEEESRENWLAGDELDEEEGKEKLLE